MFTEIDIPAEYFQDVIRRQAVVNKGITFRFRNQVAGKFEVTEYCYENGITQYLGGARRGRCLHHARLL